MHKNDKKNITRFHLSKKIYQNIGFSKNLSSKIVDDCFETIIRYIIKCDKIKIATFGTFKVLNKRERIGRNPKTKEETKISSRKVVSFKPSITFKEKINRNERK